MRTIWREVDGVTDPTSPIKVSAAQCSEQCSVAHHGPLILFSTCLLALLCKWQSWSNAVAVVVQWKCSAVQCGSVQYSVVSMCQCQCQYATLSSNNIFHCCPQGNIFLFCSCDTLYQCSAVAQYSGTVQWKFSAVQYRVGQCSAVQFSVSSVAVQYSALVVHAVQCSGAVVQCSGGALQWWHNAQKWLSVQGSLCAGLSVQLRSAVHYMVH
jgi:hypothetical protein